MEELGHNKWIVLWCNRAVTILTSKQLIFVVLFRAKVLANSSAEPFCKQYFLAIRYSHGDAIAYDGMFNKLLIDIR